MKKILIGCMAMMITMALWSFTQTKDKQEWKPSATAVWYYYDDSGDPNLQVNYSLTPPVGGCEGAETHCAIMAEPDGTTPGRPDQDDVNAASAASANFTEEEPGIVDFKEQ